MHTLPLQLAQVTMKGAIAAAKSAGRARAGSTPCPRKTCSTLGVKTRSVTMETTFSPNTVQSRFVVRALARSPGDKSPTTNQYHCLSEPYPF